MSENKTKPTGESVESFLATVSERRRAEAHSLITIMQEISGEKPVMWGPSIIGFGLQHYEYDTGRGGEMGLLGFSPRKASITVYFIEGFDRYSQLLARLGKYKTSVSCLYINKLADVDMAVLRQMIAESYALATSAQPKLATAEEYRQRVPAAARPKFDELRALVKEVIPNAHEVLSYGIIGYKIDNKRARVYVSGWKDHVAMYPIPKSQTLQAALRPYAKGKGTLWFGLDDPLPAEIIQKTVKALVA